MPCCLTLFRYNGITYGCESYHGGDCIGTGQRIVDSIPTSTDAYKVWLKDRKAFFVAEYERIKNLEEEHGGLVEDYLWPYVKIPSECPELDPGYEYYYFVDLTTEAFCLSDAQFPLWNVPRGDNGDDWVQYLDWDGFCTPILRPDTPRRFCHRVSIKPPPVSEDLLTTYRFVARYVEIIDESTWMTFSDDHPSSILASCITRGLMMYHNSKIHAGSPFNHRDSKLLHVYAKLLLRAASPAGLFLSAARSADDFPNYPFDNPSWNFYRYRGCIVFVTKDCSTAERLQAHIVFAIKHAQKTRRNNCTFIIFSIQHIAVAEVTGAVSGTLHVSHSNILPFLDTFGHEGFEKGLNLISHYLRPYAIDGGPVMHVSPESGSQSPGRPFLPLDIILRIMGLVDSETYNTLNLVCKALRREWFQHPRICNYRILSGKMLQTEICNYLPNSRFSAMRDDGSNTSLRVFYPVNRFHNNYDAENYIEPSHDHCCPHPHLCEDRKCAMPLELYLLPRCDQFCKLPWENSACIGANWQIAHYGEATRKWNRYMPGLFLVDIEHACDACVRCFEMDEMENAGFTYSLSDFFG